MTDILGKLFGSEARVKLLRLFLFNPSQTFAPADIARRTQASPKDVRLELSLLKRVGVVTRTSRARIPRYALNTEFAYIAALQNLLLNAPMRAGEIYDRIRRTGAFKLVVVGGVFVGEWEGRVDLLIVGDRVRESRLRQAIGRLEAEVGKELRYTLLNTQEFHYRLNMNDHLVRDVLDYPHQIVFDRLDIGLE